MRNVNTYAFILAGGSGERFWPLSRTSTPKHLLRIFDDRTLLEHTVERLEGTVPVENIYVLTNVAQATACRAVLPMLPPQNIVAEPAKRDTAPACTLATAIAAARDPEAVCILLPADAMIHNHETFRKQLAAMATAATMHDAIVTFAIPPKYAATGYGYLHLGEEIAETSTMESSAPCIHARQYPLVRVEKFVEKPDERTAEQYLASNTYGWNAGIFAWRASWFRQELDRLQPELAAFVARFPQQNAEAYIEQHFPTLPKISVDYAVMEHTREVLAIRAAFDWDDVGSWLALPAHLGHDDDGNCIRGEAVVCDSRNNIVFSTKRLIALCGVHNLVVIETDDTILVCHRDAAQNIKALQPHLPENLR